MSKEALEPILKRSSCRRFTGEPLRDGDLELLMEVVRRAPSAGNRQPWFFYIVLENEMRQQMADAALGQNFVAQAPVVFVACVEPEISACKYGERGRSLFALQDVAAAVENLLIAATALGYGSCWVGAFEEDKVREVIHLPGYRRPIALIPIGPGVIDPNRTDRRPLEKMFEIIA